MLLTWGAFELFKKVIEGDSPLLIMTTNLLYGVFILFNKIGDGFAGAGFLDGTASTYIDQIALAIKPIAYVLLSVFALVEFIHLAERMSNINGFMGTSLVIEVLVKILIAKLVIDNSTEICRFIMEIIDEISKAVAGQAPTDVITSQQVHDYLSAIWPSNWDLVGQVGMFALIIIFVILSLIITTIAYVVFVARILQIYVYMSISPIPLSTALSKEFNVATNFLKNFFAVGLQGVLLILLLRFYSIIVTREMQSVFNPDQSTGGFVSQIIPGGSGVVSTVHLTVVLLFCSILLLITVFQTEKWAKSICYAI